MKWDNCSLFFYSKFQEFEHFNISVNLTGRNSHKHQPLLTSTCPCGISCSMLTIKWVKHWAFKELLILTSPWEQHSSCTGCTVSGHLHLHGLNIRNQTETTWNGLAKPLSVQHCHICLSRGNWGGPFHYSSDSPWLPCHLSVLPSKPVTHQDASYSSYFSSHGCRT